MATVSQSIAHTVVPGAAVWVQHCGVGGGVVAGAKVGGHGVEGGEVEAGQAGHGAAQVYGIAVFFWH